MPVELLIDAQVAAGWRDIDRAAQAGRGGGLPGQPVYGKSVQNDEEMKRVERFHQLSPAGQGVPAARRGRCQRRVIATVAIVANRGLIRSGRLPAAQAYVSVPILLTTQTPPSNLCSACGEPIRRLGYGQREAYCHVATMTVWCRSGRSVATPHPHPPAAEPPRRYRPLIRHLWERR